MNTTFRSTTPGDGKPNVYLCQVGSRVSCGACCGLYNVADPSPAALEALLTRRTRWFADVPRTVAGIDAFKAHVEAAEARRRPFPDFHHCPFLGMIEDAGCRVGCLLHPLARGNEGLDWRGLSHYGGMACRTYFCPSVKQLPDRWLNVVGQSMDHWYLHGLIVTERQLLTAFFQTVEKRIGRPVSKTDFCTGSHAAALFKRFAALKIEWPYRRQGAPGVCNYFFEDGQYLRPRLKATRGKRSDPEIQEIFQELDSEFDVPADLHQAETDIGHLVESITALLRS
ncbi:MAG: hypothetical protein CSA23_03775 [Deltaproteobacteria bacterium]|nr:MAG: hypothetical protein CSA23_03775 [Deltaproteobacteria bacterium]